MRQIVHSVQFHVGDVIMDLPDIQLELLDDLSDQGRLHRFAVLRNPFRRPPQPSVVELVG